MSRFIPLVPLGLKRKCAALYWTATRQPTQKEADVIIRILMPEWQGDTLQSKAHTRAKEAMVDIHDRQMASTYSLELCQGGAGYHHASPTTRPEPVYSAPTLNAQVDVSEEYEHPPIPTHVRGPKSYLPEYDPKKKVKTPDPVMDVHNDLLEM